MLWFAMDDWNFEETVYPNKLTETYILWWDLRNALYLPEYFYSTVDISIVDMSARMPADFNKI